jgi:GNAT superfamily N-acetyltransferase
MPLPSMTTMMPGHGGGVAGTDVKNGTAISTMYRARYPDCGDSVPRMTVSARLAGADDLDAVVDTIAVAFHHDPVWSWAFPDAGLRPAQFRRWWPLFVGSALPNRFVWMAPGAETVAVWVPPGVAELTDDAEARIPPLLSELLGERSRIVLEGLLQFEAAHPRDEAHYYLSFVATHDDFRGHGIGEQLLCRNLELIDAEHRPAYLESSNPKNLTRYGRLGFEPVGEFVLPDHGPTVTSMWRPAR